MNNTLIRSGFPEVICKQKLHPQEFCYTVYLPIAKNGRFFIPDNFKWVVPLILAVKEEDYSNFKYVYLTVKHMWVDGYGNREGWHIDGYGTEDINYIWADCVPTEICVQDFFLSDDHDIALEQMKYQVEQDKIRSLNACEFVRLDNTVVHRTVKTDKPTLRTFIKISLSNEKYNLKGNAINEYLSLDCKYVDRKETRNHTVGN